jgi:Tfp pilus assembly protein PilN
MKAVNLIPAAEGRGPGGSSAGLATYAVLGVLALAVVLTAAYSLAGRAANDKKVELAQITTRADDAEASAGDLKSFTEFANARKARVETINGLVKGRFDWAHAMNEVARTLPASTWIMSLRASTSPSASVDGTSDPLRSALAVPAVELTGCAADQDGVARAIVSLRRISKVQRVTLSSSEKQGEAGETTTDEDGCGARAQFSLSIFFEAPEAGATTAGGTTP